VADILFKGGPCAGKHDSFDENVPGDGTISCGGQVYHFTRVADGEYLGTLPGERTPPEFEPVDATPTHAASGWNALMHALGHDLQAGMRRTQVASRRIAGR
jgi:hypothetical protein